MAFGNNDVEIKIKVDSQGATQVFDALGNKIADVGGVVGKGESAWTTYNQALSLIKQTAAIVSSSLSTVFDTLERGSAVDDVEQSFRRLAQSAGELSTIFLQQLNDATADTISNFDLQKQAIEGMRAGIKPDEFVELTRAARALAEQTGGQTKDSLDQLSRAFETGRTRALQNSLGVIDLEAAQQKLADSLGITRDKLTAEQQVLAARTALLEAARKKTAEVGDITKDAGDQIATFNKVLSDTKDQAAKAIAGSAGLNKVLQTLNDTLTKLPIKAFVAGLETIVDAAVATGSAIIDAFKGLPIIGELFKEAAIQVDLFKTQLQFATILDKFGETVKEFATAPVKELNDEMKVTVDISGAVKTVTEKIAEGYKEVATSAVIATDEVRALEEALSDQAAEGRALREETDKIRQQFIGVGVDFGASLISGGFNKQNLKDSVRGLGGSLGAAGAAALGVPALAPIFSAVGDKLGKAVFDGFNHVFGGRDAQGKIRDSLDKLFADALKDNPLQAIINGQLQSITDLTFGKGTNSFVDGTFDDAFQSMGESAQRAFQGIATGFTGVLGQGEELSSQLAAIFANNLGGSLNNLQLLVEATGKSFEDLKKGVVEAFLDGKLSALEAQTALIGIQQVSEKGIPGAIGAVTEAFDNLKAAGVKGGRALIDALKDIGYEATELGIKDLAGVQAYLSETGAYSADEIQKVFDALKRSGIDSIDELKNASNEGLISVAADLQAAAFPFAEATEKIGDLAEKLNSLPERIDTTVHVNFVATGDQAARNIIGQQAGIAL